MMLLWISCLLVGSISCVPAGIKYGSDPARPAFRWQPSSGHWSRGRGVSSDPGSSSSLPPWSKHIDGKASAFPAQHAIFRPGSYNTAGRYDGGSAGFKGSYSGDYASVAPAAGYGGSFASSASGSVGGGSSGFAPAPQGEEDKPVFSDVSDMDRLQGFSSRSNYDRIRAKLSRTTFRPIDAAPPVMALSKPTSSQNQNLKGGL